jgi:TPR repeat protein
MPTLAWGEPLVAYTSTQDQLPLIPDLDPYTLGANSSAYGNATSYGQRDPYVSRAADKPLRAALVPGCLVVVAGSAAVGKTRTAFEVLREHKDWNGALLAAPTPRSVEELVVHPDVRGRRPLVVWLDDLARFLPPTGRLSDVTVSRLLDRPGPMVLLATIRASQRDTLLKRDADLTREARQVLGDATWIELASTRDDPAEQARAAAAYPQPAARPEGLAETLTGLPELLRRYREAAASDPEVYAVVQASVDWARCGLRRPISESDLRALARVAPEDYGHDVADLDLDEALRRACRPVAIHGPAALLAPRRLEDGSRGYVACGFLAAADDGEGGNRGRPVTQVTWQRVLDRASSEEALGVGVAAYLHGNIPVAAAANRRAAVHGHSEAHFNLAVLLTDCLDPPDLASAFRWYVSAAEAGHTSAQNNLAMLLASRLDPPDLAGACHWWTLAAEAEDTEAQFRLGMLLAGRLDPPDLAGARHWWTLASEAGDADAQFNLGVLLADRLDPPDLAGARHWYTLAANAGNADAQFNLGMLLAGRVTPPDLAQARAWWTLAAGAGHVGAQFNLASLAEALSPPDLAEARRWYASAAEAGDVEALSSLERLAAQGA